MYPRRITRHSVRPSEYFVQVESGLEVFSCAPAASATPAIVLAAASAERISSDFIVGSVMVLSNRTEREAQGLPMVAKAAVRGDIEVCLPRWNRAPLRSLKRRRIR